MRTRRQMREYIAREIRYGNPFKSGMCKRQTRTAYDIPSDGSIDAADAWDRTKHRVTGFWVPWVFVWWRGGTPDPETGKRHGHVAITRWRKGRIFTVDFPNKGRWNRTTIDALEAAWPNIHYLGMSLDIDGRKVRDMPRKPRFRRAWWH